MCARACPALDKLLVKLIGCVDKSLHALHASQRTLTEQWHHRREWLLRKSKSLEAARKHTEHEQARTRSQLRQVHAEMRGLAKALKALEHRLHETTEERKHMKRTLHAEIEHEKEKQKLFAEQLELLRALLKLLAGDGDEVARRHAD